MKYLVILALGTSIFCSCGQGEERLDNPDGDNAKSYTDQGTTDSTRLMNDTTMTHGDSMHKQDGTNIQQ